MRVLASIRPLLAAMLLPACLLGGEPIRLASPAPEPRFNRLYDYEELTELLRRYRSAYPGWVELESLGTSAEGRELWLLTVNNPATGPDRSKPAMYIDANIHANEVQGAETALYTVDFLLKQYGRLERVTELLDRVAFYFVPVVNPDGRARWFAEPATPHFPRTVATPVDDDRDGRADEDGFNDLDGDGIITRMRKRVPKGQGTHRLHSEDPRLLRPVEEDEEGDWIPLGAEGVDDDGDGAVNEDPIGYVDPNRTWGYGWEPRYIQRGAGDYPLQIPETRAIALWAVEHPNIGAVQSYHNAGEMILRGPGAKSMGAYPRSDVRVYDIIGERGEELLPDYDYMIVWKDLYTVYGSTIDHFHAIHGAVAYTNELYAPPADLDGDGEVTDLERLRFNDLLTLGRQFVPWTEVNHPQYGRIEVGGFRHDVGRVPEGWLLEEEIHRNNAFVLYHARQLPRLSFGDPEVERLGPRLWRLHVPVHNDRAIPTMTATAQRQRAHRPDIATIEGGRVLSSGVVRDRWLDEVDLQEHRPERLLVQGVPGRSHRLLFFLVEGRGRVRLTYDSVKGGTISTTVPLQERKLP